MLRLNQKYTREQWAHIVEILLGKKQNRMYFPRTSKFTERWSEVATILGLHDDTFSTPENVLDHLYTFVHMDEVKNAFCKAGMFDEWFEIIDDHDITVGV
jgi:hypothetical protein